MRGKVLPYMPAFQPHRGKPAVRNDREVEETTASFEARVRASTLPQLRGALSNGRPYRVNGVSSSR
jgi:hypothetical protein